jgi:hypothetical protein
MVPSIGVVLKTAIVLLVELLQRSKIILACIEEEPTCNWVLRVTVEETEEERLLIIPLIPLSKEWY